LQAGQRQTYRDKCSVTFVRVDSLFRACTVAKRDKISTETDSTKHVVQGTLSGQSSLSRTRTETLKTKQAYMSGSALALELKSGLQCKYGMLPLTCSSSCSLNTTSTHLHSSALCTEHVARGRSVSERNVASAGLSGREGRLPGRSTQP
jgi:hypothetical protein